MIFNSSNYSVRICLESCGYFFVKLILKIFDKRYVPHTCSLHIDFACFHFVPISG